MGMWILILFFLPATQHDGKAATTASYFSQKDCEKALGQVQHLFKNSKDDGDVVGVCTYQGEEE